MNMNAEQKKNKDKETGDLKVEVTGFLFGTE